MDLRFVNEGRESGSHHLVSGAIHAIGRFSNDDRALDSSGLFFYKRRAFGWGNVTPTGP